MEAPMKRLWLLAAFLAFLVVPAAAQQVPATANLTAQDTGACTTANACLFVNVPKDAASSVIQLSGTWTATVQFEASTGSGPSGSPFTAITGTPVAGTGAVSSATANGAWRFNVSSVYVIRARVSSYGGGTVQAAITASAASTFSSTGFIPPPGGGINGAGTANNYAMFTDPTDIGNAPTLLANGIIQNANPTSQPLVLFLCQNSASGTADGLLVTRDANGNCINLPAAQTTKIVGVVYAGGGTSGTSMLCKIGSCPITLDNTSVVNDCIVASSANAQGHDAGAICPTGVQQLGIAQNVNAGPGTNATVDVFISDVQGGPNGSGQTIQVGGVTVAGTLDNFSNTTPAAQANFLNCFFQTDNGVPTSDISLECPEASTSQEGFIKLAQDLCGTNLMPNVCGIQTIPVTFTTPATNDVICFQTPTTLGNCTLGVPVRTVTGNSDTILSTDRVSDVRYTAASGATAVALSQAGSAGFANSFTMVLTNAQGSGTVTVTPTVSTVNGSATLDVPAGNYCFLYSDNANYYANCGVISGAGGGGGSVASVAQTVPGGFAVSGSPITTSGTLAITTNAAGPDYLLTSTALNTSAWKQINGGSSCGDSTHATSYDNSTHTFGCQSITGTGGGGSVTSIGLSVPAASIFGVTGSPVTTSGTLGLTTTGTSGGIPYFSSTSQLATSGALSANKLTKGGGAGVAPLDSSVTDTGTSPTQTPNGLNTITSGNYDQWTVDTGGVTANKLACRSGTNKAQICATNTTQGVLGVALGTVTVGNPATICWAAHCNVIPTNNTTAGHWLIPSATVAGDVDDTGSTVQPTGTQTFLAESTVTAPAVVATTILSPDAVGASAGGFVTAVTGSSGAASSGGTTPNITVTANVRTRGLVFSYGDPGSANSITAGSTATDYMTVPFACTISAYNILIDAGTITIKFWKIATGTAIPTVSNSINTSGVAISSGTAIHSTTVSDFTTTTVTANDIIAMNVSTVATAKFVSATLECDQ
jgi:hypothetical protein